MVSKWSENLLEISMNVSGGLLEPPKTLLVVK